LQAPASGTGFTEDRAGSGAVTSPTEQAQSDAEDEGTLAVGSLNMDPDVVNMRGGGRYMTAYLELPDGCSVLDVYLPSVRLNGIVRAETCFAPELFDTDKDGVEELMMKFVKDNAKKTLVPGSSVTVTVAGIMDDGTPFTASDQIKVVSR